MESPITISSPRSHLCISDIRRDVWGSRYGEEGLYLRTGRGGPKAAGGGRNRRALGTGGPGEGADLAAFKRALDERDGDVERLRGENARLRGEVERLSGINQELKERNKVLLAAYAEVEGLMASLREQASEWLTDS